MTTGHTFNTDQTRAVFGKRLGEIIEDVIGDARVRELFDAAGKHPEDYEGKPTGMIALDLGVITPDTKTALLVAQAAERTLQLADKAKFLPTLGYDEEARRKYSGTNCVPDTDPIFKFVGSPRDPEILQRAQATWKIAQINLNEEVGAFEDRIAHLLPLRVNERIINGLHKAAAELYGAATQMLQAEGHADAAEKLDAVSKSIQFDDKSAISVPDIVEDLKSHISINIKMKNTMGGFDDIVLPDGDFIPAKPGWSIDKEYDAELSRLAKLTESEVKLPKPPAPGMDVK